MKLTFSLILGLIAINALILIYERGETFAGWKLYMGLAGLTLLSAISLPFGLMLLIPITGYNLLVNTGRLMKRIGGN